MQKKQDNTPTVTASIRTNRAFRKGVTLVEVALAIVIMIISLLGVSSAYVSGKRQIIKQAQYQLAVNLASEKLEEIKAQGYFATEVDEAEDAYFDEGDEELTDEEDDNREKLSLYGLPCFRQTMVELTAETTPDVPNPCKKVTVTVKWTGLAEDPHEVKLITYIGP